MYKLITYFLASVVLLSLIVANIVASGSLSTAGEDLRSLDSERQVLIEENQVLETYILNSTSLQSLQQLANEMGFDRPEEVVALNLPNQSVALRQ